MHHQTEGRSRQSRLRALLPVAMMSVGMALAAATAGATTITGSVGGVPSGADLYENFDSVPLGGESYITPGGITVTFGNDGQAVQGASSGRYAAPFLSGGNGSSFGNLMDGADQTTYFSSGSTNSNPAANVTLSFARPEHYLGLLWGSVDDFNTLAFYRGAIEVGRFTGADVSSLANGDQGAGGTYYVNIDLSDSFTSVVATSSSYAFEFDNVAVSADTLKVSEPGAAGLFLLGLLLVGSAYRLKLRRRFGNRPS